MTKKSVKLVKKSAKKEKLSKPVLLHKKTAEMKTDYSKKSINLRKDGYERYEERKRP